MKKQSNLSRLLEIAGSHTYLTYASWVLSAISALIALVAAGAIYGVLLVCILVKKRSILKSWLVVSAVTIVLYLPWLKCFAEQLAFKVSNEYWIAFSKKFLLFFVFMIKRTRLCSYNIRI